MRLSRTFAIITVILMLSASAWAVSAQDGVRIAQGQPSAQPTLPPAPGAPVAPPVDPLTEIIEEELLTDDINDEGNESDVDIPDDDGTPTITQPTMPTAPITGDACPTLVTEGYTATELICGNVGAGEACIGNGVVMGTPRGTEEISFGQPGDIVPLNTLSEIRLQTVGTANNVMAVVRLQPELPVVESTDSANATIYLVGDVTLVDASEESGASAGTFPFANVQAGGGLNVRNAPNTTGTVIWQLTANERVIATGRTSDQQWIRIEIPSIYGGVGWVFGRYMDVDGGLEALPFVTENSPAPQVTVSGVSLSTSQRFALLSAPINETCVDAPPSGLLIQSPSGFSAMMLFEVNGVRLELNGTAFISAQADGRLQADVLEGSLIMSANDSTLEMVLGASAGIAMNVNLEPIGTVDSQAGMGDLLLNLPLNLLPRGFGVGDGTIFSGVPAPTIGTATDDDNACILTAPNEVRNIRQGPGTAYETAGTLEPNASLEAFAQALDSFNFIWYETMRGFIRFDAVDRQGNCSDLPDAENIPPIPETSPEEESATAPTTTNALTSTLLGDVCTRTSVQTSLDVSGGEFAYALGGLWEASPQTRVTFVVQGAVMRGEYGDYIRLTYEDGSTLAGSGNSTTMTVTFNERIRFNTNVSATNGDFVILTVRCD